MVERDSENLSIVFVEIGLVVVVVGLVPLFYFGGGFGRQGLVAVDAAGAADGGSEAIAGLGLGVGVDVGLEAVEEEEWDLEESKGERGKLPNVISYSTLINGYCKIKMVDEALRLLTEMHQRNLVPGQLQLKWQRPR